MAPQTSRLSVSTPRPLLGSFFRPPGRTMVHSMSPPISCGANTSGLAALTAYARMELLL